MREKWNRFMMGRYGADELSRHLTVVELVLLIANMFLKNNILLLLALILLIYTYYRMFSRDYNRRREENLKYLSFRNKVTYRFSQQKSELQQRKTHHIYRCPSCKQKIRVPKGKGKIIVTCPKCRTEFQKRS